LTALPAATLTWDGVLAWRMRRQMLEAPESHPVPDVVRELCGVQAQVPSSAELAIALRRTTGRAGDAAQTLSDRKLLRTWAMRGTLHLLTPDQAPALLSLMAALRTWERPAWQRSFGVSADEVQTLAETVGDVLDGRVLERDELIEEVAARSGSRELDEHLRSGWGAVLKPLAWMGLLCNGPSRGNRVTFTTPSSWIEGWPGLPDADTAARAAIPAYLRAYGPATPAAFDAWLTRGTSRKADLRRWFDELGDDLATVDVEGEPRMALRADLDELTNATPSQSVRLLAGFDQYLLGPGTNDARILAPARRKQVSKAAGWISPVVIHQGRVAGTWQPDGGSLRVSLFAESEPVDRAALETECARVAACIGREMAVSLEVV
jgi:DNA glycosylase AlkZ-like